MRLECADAFEAPRVLMALPGQFLFVWKTCPFHHARPQRSQGLARRPIPTLIHFAAGHQNCSVPPTASRLPLSSNQLTI